MKQPKKPEKKICIELRTIHHDNKRRNRVKILPSKTRFKERLPVSTKKDETEDTAAYRSMQWGYKTISCVSIPLPQSYEDLQVKFAKAFPQHDKLVIVEQENGTKISSQQKNFDKFDKIIFREFQPGLLHDKGKTKAKGLPETWEEDNFYSTKNGNMQLNVEKS